MLMPLINWKRAWLVALLTANVGHWPSFAIDSETDRQTTTSRQIVAKRNVFFCFIIKMWRLVLSLSAFLFRPIAIMSVIFDFSISVYNPNRNGTEAQFTLTWKWSSVLWFLVLQKKIRFVFLLISRQWILCVQFAWWWASWPWLVPTVLVPVPWAWIRIVIRLRIAWNPPHGCRFRHCNRCPRWRKSNWSSWKRCRPLREPIWSIACVSKPRNKIWKNSNKIWFLFFPP